uniref:Fibronectin type-III domain-containing protein n=1 Tax=Knipowitschia caucasica TaxID=637954 RepID=A0AAV2L0Q2_KNICA
MGLKWVLLLLVLQVSLQSSHAALNIGVYSASTKHFVFKWDKVNGAMSYEITITNIANQRVGFAVFGANTVMGSVSSGLAANTNYTYSIEAKNATGAVLESASGQHLTAPERMDPIVSVTAVDSTTLQVEFVLKTGASKYIVRALDTQEPLTFFKEIEVTSSPALFPSLQPYTQYKLSVMAANSGGRSQPTESVIAKTFSEEQQEEEEEQQEEEEEEQQEEEEEEQQEEEEEEQQEEEEEQQEEEEEEQQEEEEEEEQQEEEEEEQQEEEEEQQEDEEEEQQEEEEEEQQEEEEEEQPEEEEEQQEEEEEEQQEEEEEEQPEESLE